MGWLKPMVFLVVTKSQVNFQTYEEEEKISFDGVWQPFSDRKLQMKPEGQRSWKWFTCHSFSQLPLDVDMIIEYVSKKYRVMEIRAYPEYGYYEYHLVDDYSGSGPYEPT